MMSRNRRLSSALASPSEQRFDVAANRRERRAQLVRHVGDEVAADLVGAPKLGDVVQHEDGAVRAAAGGRRRAGHDRARRIARRRQLQRVGRPPGERRRHQFGDRRMADRLDVVASERQLVELQHPLRGLVDELQPSLRIDDDDAFDHAGEDRFHARAVARLLGQLAPDDLHRVVERPRDDAELVVAVVEARRRQIAAAIPAATSAMARTRWPIRDGEHPADARSRRPAPRRAPSASR